MTADLRERVRSVLGQRAERWYDGLATDLAAWCWSDLASIGLNPDSYGSARVLRLTPTAPRNGHLSKAAGWNRPLIIEPFDEILTTQYGPLGLRAPAEPFDLPTFEEGLERAMAQLDRVEAVGAAVRLLVWSVTPIDVEGPDYDTGYSDPTVPLSIFIGAHRAADHVSPIRLAEAVLHEAMHLQLSLIEDIAPLVQGGGQWRHSPWQNRLRPTQGLLHGLYVFRVVQDFFRAAIATRQLSSDDITHARNRVVQIDEECAELAGLAESLDLTGDGRTLANALLG